MRRKTRICQRCGRVMPGAAVNQKWCPDCARTQALAYQRTPSRTARARKKQDGPLSIDEVARRARAEGVSYGVYVARHGLVHAARP